MIGKYISECCEFSINKIINIWNLNQDRKDTCVELNLIGLKFVGGQKPLGENILHTLRQISKKCNKESDSVKMNLVC